MAGDWIKVEKTTARKSEILRVAHELGVHPDHAFGLCFRFWCWCDDNLVDGNATGVTDVMLDALLGRDGFAKSLVNVGWLRVRNGSLEVPNYDRHLSENAKKRGLSQKRTAKSRGKQCNAHVTVGALPEKRREEKSLNKKQKDVREDSTHWKEEGFRTIWFQWVTHVGVVSNPLSEPAEQQQLYELERFSTEDAIKVVRFSLKANAKNLILNGDHNRSDQPRGSPGGRKPRLGSDPIPF